MKLELFLVSILSLIPFGISAPKEDGNTKIVGGDPVNIYEHPHQVALLYFGSHICGGVLILPRFVLTSVTCIADGHPTQFSIRAGSSYANEGGIVVDVNKIHIHPNYNEFTFDFDVAILYLDSALYQDSTIDFANLVAAGTPIPAGIEATVTGWGTLGESGEVAHQLQEVKVNILSGDDCKEAYGDITITENMLCAGVTGGGKDACVGDAGGPLQLNDQVIGLVSWGYPGYQIYGCGRPEYPGVYTNLAYCREWITSVTGA
nr:vitellin-degrading protease-like [Onthophagus taurus]